MRLKISASARSSVTTIPVGARADRSPAPRRSAAAPSEAIGRTKNTVEIHERRQQCQRGAQFQPKLGERQHLLAIEADHQHQSLGAERHRREAEHIIAAIIASRPYAAAVGAVAQRGQQRIAGAGAHAGHGGRRAPNDLAVRGIDDHRDVVDVLRVSVGQLGQPVRAQRGGDHPCRRPLRQRPDRDRRHDIGLAVETADHHLG
jgi:hypothetical protein